MKTPAESARTQKALELYAVNCANTVESDVEVANLPALWRAYHAAGWAVDRTGLSRYRIAY